MKVAKVFSIIGLILSLVMGIIAIGTSFVLKNTDAIDDLEQQGDFSTIDNLKNMNILLIGIPVAIITGILGFIGPNKKPINIKPKYFWIVLLFCVILLFLLRQSISAIIYIIVVLLYFIDYRKNIKEINKVETT